MTAADGDGRTARRSTNRQEVVEATLALVDEGELRPSIDAITVRSGVSARSIFRYFDGLEDLRHAVVRLGTERLEPLVGRAGRAEGPLEARVQAFVAARLKLHETSAGPTRLVRTLDDPAAVTPETDRLRLALLAQVRSAFGPELSAMGRAEADDTALLIDTLTSFDSWDRLNGEHGRSRSLIRRSWTRGVGRLLAT